MEINEVTGTFLRQNLVLGKSNIPQTNHREIYEREINFTIFGYREILTPAYS